MPGGELGSHGTVLSEFADMHECFWREIHLISRAQPDNYHTIELGPSLAPKWANTAHFTPCVDSSSMSVSD
jgi:hypothetical protein